MKYGLGLVVTFLVGATSGVFIVQQNAPKPAPPVEHNVQVGKYIQTYADGLQAVYTKAAEKSAEGEFSDLLDANEFVYPAVQQVRESAFGPIREKLEAINGEGWSNEKARDTFLEIADEFKIESEQ